MAKFKLRIFFKTGFQKGNLRKEEFFESKAAMQQRYRSLYDPKEYDLNPTALELVGNKWIRTFDY